MATGTGWAYVLVHMKPLVPPLLVLLTGCLHSVPERRPPSDARDRERAEAAACWSGTFPPWLDDRALEEASRMDRWSAVGSDPNENFRTGTYAAAPALPPPRSANAGNRSGYAAITRERQEFQMRCNLMRSKGRGLTPGR